MTGPQSYTIQDPQSGKPVTFKWKAAEPPTAEEQAEILELWRERNGGGGQQPATPAQPPAVPQGMRVKLDQLSPEELAHIQKVGGFENPQVQAQLRAEGLLEEDTSDAFTSRLGQNAKGLATTALDLMPGGSAALKQMRGEETNWTDAIPGKQTVLGIAANLKDKWQAAGAETDPVAKAGRYAGLVPEALGIPVTEMGEALGSGNYGKLGADVLTAGALGVAFRGGPRAALAEAKAWMPRTVDAPVAAPAARPGAPAAGVPGADLRAALDHYIQENVSGNPAVKNPGQLYVDAANGNQFPSRPGQPSQPSALDVLQEPRVLNDAIESTIPVERPHSQPWEPDHLEALDIPANRAVLQPDEAWMRALQKDVPPMINHAPQTAMRRVLDEVLREGNYQYKLPTVHKTTFNYPPR